MQGRAVCFGATNVQHAGGSSNALFFNHAGGGRVGWCAFPTVLTTIARLLWFPPSSVRDPQLECFYSALRPCPSLHIIGDKASRCCCCFAGGGLPCIG